MAERPDDEGLVSAGSDESWRPTATRERLVRRAALLARIRAFFAARGLIEVETPLLAAAPVTDLHLASFRVPLEAAGSPDATEHYLQTSPEFAMKRLLAAESGPIYQITKAFRRDEAGRLHNPEFTMLEWYRPGFDHHALMDEVDEFLGVVLEAPAAERVSYGQLFIHHLDVDPHRDPTSRLREAARNNGIDTTLDEDDRDGYMHLLMSHLIEPELGCKRPTFVYDFPASQAALARLSRTEPEVAERFEVYIAGMELANGFHELTDASEQRTRFMADLEARRARELEAVPIDERFLAALAAGLPACAGVALGVDRLAMLEANASRLAEVIAFPFDRA